MHMHVVNHSLLGKMRKAGTVGRTYFIDAALIIFQVEELAGCALVDPVAGAPLLAQPLLRECLRGHAEMSRDAFDILVSVSWRHRLAAIGALQTIYLRPHALLSNECDLIQSAWRIFFQR